MEQIFVRPELCMGCMSCELACAVRHSRGKTLVSAIMETPAPKKRLSVEMENNVKMPVPCRHCEDAPCVNECITGCLFHDDNGFVQNDEDRCIGCWSCIMACPFGAIARDEVRHVAIKCDRCRTLEVPACVSACPTKALVLVNVDAFARDRRKRVVLEETAALRDRR